MVAAGIVQNMFAGGTGDGEGGEERSTGCFFYHCFYRSGRKFFRFLAIEFLSQNTKILMRIRKEGVMKHYISWTPQAGVQLFCWVEWYS